MCGISGIFAFSRDGQVDPQLVADMSATLVHRGPDGDGLRRGDGYAIAHRRLAIVDVAAGRAFAVSFRVQLPAPRRGRAERSRAQNQLANDYSSWR